MKSDEAIEHKSLKVLKASAHVGSPHFPGIGPWLPDLPASWCPRPTHSLLPHYCSAAAATSYTYLPGSLGLGKVGIWYAECHDSVVGNLRG